MSPLLTVIWPIPLDLKTDLDNFTLDGCRIFWNVALSFESFTRFVPYEVWIIFLNGILKFDPPFLVFATHLSLISILLIPWVLAGCSSRTMPTCLVSVWHQTMSFDISFIIGIHCCSWGWVQACNYFNLNDLLRISCRAAFCSLPLIYFCLLISLHFNLIIECGPVLIK